MQWYNEPGQWQTDDEQSLSVTAQPKTDFWRKTHNGQINDNGHFYYQEIEGDFVCEVKVSGQYSDLYDQAGLMLRLDEHNWLKCGIEFVERQQVSAVVTRDWSDWSIVPLDDEPTSLWLRLTRAAETVEVHYSLDGADYRMLRQTFLPPQEFVQVGLMCAAPIGNGFAVEFEGFVVSDLPPAVEAAV